MKSDQPRRSLGFPRRLRICERAVFEQILARGARAGDGKLLLRALPNGLEYSRLGLLIRRQHGDAPRRNRLKRWIRESFRLSQHELPSGLDFLCSPVKPDELTFQSTLESLPRLAARLARRLQASTREPESGDGG